MFQLRSAFALGLLVSAGAIAQPPGPPHGPGPRGHFEGGDFAFLGARFGMEGKVVKGSPYTAQATTDFTQTLADGNVIHRTNTSSIARDSEGRTRRDQTISAIGSIGASGSSLKSTMIHDPVAGVSYMLDASSKTAHMNHLPQRGQGQAWSHGAPGGTQPDAVRRQARVRPDVKTEDLGTQVMDGLSVQGKRTTHTIPAGELGNASPMLVVTETWFSQDLQAVVMSKTTDPRNGTSVYKLTNVSRTEPDPTLFQVPSDFTVTEGHGGRPPRANQ